MCNGFQLLLATATRLLCHKFAEVQELFFETRNSFAFDHGDIDVVELLVGHMKQCLSLPNRRLQRR